MAIWSSLAGGAASTISSVFGRIGAVVAAAFDYAASQVSAVAHGTTAATDVQGQLDEITDEKADKTTTITTSSPLSGGGDLSAHRTFSVADLVGDSGSGGTRGVVPAPAAGDAAAGKFLKADATWTAPPASGAPADAKYIVQAAHAGLSAEQALGDLATGIVKNTTSTGVLSIAAAGTDYAAASHTHGLADITDEGALAALNTVGTAQIDNDAVTYAKLQNVSATSRFLGRITTGAGDTEELTGTQATTLLDLFTSALKGLVPASGGGTTTFLRADGTFAAPTAAAADPVYSPGSFTVATESGRYIPARLQLTTTQRATLEGTARLVIT